ncbi:MAG: zinc ribbon domain-containing protein [Acidobacteriota bacterium]
MYCPVCGAESTPGLNYCKRCGAVQGSHTNPVDTGQIVARPFAMLLPVAIVSIVGLVGYFMTITNLSDRMFEPRALIGISAFAGATLLGVVGGLIWLLMQLTGIRKGISHAETGGRSLSHGSTQPQLQAPPASVPSITENTTRNFDAARLRDRNTSE